MASIGASRRCETSSEPAESHGSKRLESPLSNLKSLARKVVLGRRRHRIAPGIHAFFFPRGLRLVDAELVPAPSRSFAVAAKSSM